MFFSPFPQNAESTSYCTSEVVISGQLTQLSLGMRKLKHKETRIVVQSSMNGFILITLNLSVKWFYFQRTE